MNRMEALAIAAALRDKLSLTETRNCRNVNAVNVPSLSLMVNGANLHMRSLDSVNQENQRSPMDRTASLSKTENSSVESSSERKTRRKPNFTDRLNAVLSSDEFHDIISWLPCGRTFCITDKVTFMKQILPKYFREAKFESFVRRLKRWGFRKINGTVRDKRILFTHDVFRNNRPDRCRTKHRRETDATNVKEIGAVFNQRLRPNVAFDRLMLLVDPNFRQYQVPVNLYGLNNFVIQPIRTMPVCVYNPQNSRTELHATAPYRPLPIPYVPSDSRVSMTLRAINDDIRNFEEQLDRLKALKLQRRSLEENSGLVYLR